MGFTLKQREFFRCANHRWNIKSGATRSGKTYMDYFVIPKRIRALAKNTGSVLFLGNTKSTIQRNVIRPMQEIWGSGLVSDVKIDNTAVMFGQTVYCLGAASADQVDRIRGMSVKYCYGDEITTWHPDVFQMLKSRMDKPYSLFDGTCNPDSPDHWLKKFIDTASENEIDLFLQHYVLDDNPYCHVANQLKKEYAGTVFYERYVMGRWVRAEGLIYPKFADESNVFVKDVKPSDVKDAMFISIGVDFGGNKSASAFVASVIHKNFEKITVVREHMLRGPKGEIDAQRLNTEFLAFVHTVENAFPSIAIKYCFADCQAQYLVSGLAKTCKRYMPYLQVRDCHKARILDRIACTNALFNTERLVLDTSCVQLKSAFSQAVWDDGKVDVRLDDFSVNIDVLDAFEYSFSSFLKRI